MNTNAITADAPAQAIRVRSAEDIFSALRAPEVFARMSMLRAIAAHPAKAHSYGAWCGRTLIDELLSQLNASMDTTYRLALLSAMAGFKDQRVVIAFQRILMGTRDHQTILLLASRLSDEPEETMREFLSPLLFDETAPLRAKVIAGIMATYGTLSPRERVRIAALTDVPFPVPPMDDDTEEHWIAELSRSSDRTRRMIETFGENAFLRLRKRWPLVPDALKGWLLQWGARECAIHTVELFLDVFRNGSEELILMSLECLDDLKGAGALFQDVLASLVSHPRNEIRVAALRAGAAVPVNDIRRLLSTEESVPVRIALLRRLTEADGAGAVPDLIAHLEDGAWEIRAAATDGLIRIGGPGVEAVKPLAAHEHREVRAAAVRILIEGGHEAWPGAQCAA